MPAPDRIIPILAKIERAEEHIRDLNVAIEAFRKSDPYRAIGYDDPKTGDRVLKMQIAVDPPSRLLAILGDAIHCLRSSLDYLACQLVEAGGGKITEDTAFPISYSVKKFESPKNLGKIKGASIEAIDLIRKIEPYKGGNGDAFWRLHMLDIRDKHQFLIITAVNLVVVSVQGVIPSFFSGPLFARGFPRRGAVNDGDTLLTITREERTPEYKDDPEFVFQIGFAEIFKGEPLVPHLVQLADLIKRTLEPFRPLL